MSQQIAHFKVVAGLKWTRGEGGRRVEEKPVKSLPALYTACVCVRVVESNCALCVCACRALSQVGEVEKGT